MKNDGMTTLEYSFGEDDDLNKRMSNLLNEFCHVFRHHPDGNWKKIYKPKYTELMAKEIETKPSLIRKLIDLNDPVVKNITYAAIEQNKSES